MLQRNKQKIKFLVGALLLVVAVAAIAYTCRSYFSIFSDSERLEQIVKDAGPFGPLVFMTMQIVQVFFAPIPGQVTGFAGGYLFGTFLGTLYTVIGATIGFTLIFILARRLGRPFVEKFVSKKLLIKFDYITENQGPFILFLIFLLPVFPDDIICYIAGLTRIPIKVLVLVSVAGRLPGYIVLSFTGQGAADGNVKTVVAIFVILMVLSAAAFWKRAWLEQTVKHAASRRNPPGGRGGIR